MQQEEPQKNGRIKAPLELRPKARNKTKSMQPVVTKQNAMSALSQER